MLPRIVVVADVVVADVVCFVVDADSVYAIADVVATAIFVIDATVDAAAIAGVATVVVDAPPAPGPVLLMLH